MKNYTVVPKDCVPQQLQDEIISQLPAPIQYPGQVFKEYRFRNLSSIKITDNGGNTDNTARSGGTGARQESLQVSLNRGIDTEQYAPEIIGDDVLKDGFNRYRDLVELGYTYWVFAHYEYDEKTRTDFQKDDEDSLDDSRLGANIDTGKKPHTPSDFTNIAVKKIRKGSLKHNHESIKEWINSINHNFSPQTVGTIASNAVKEIDRAGNIEFYDRKDAEIYVSEIDRNANVLNTNSNGSTRVLRLFENIMKNYVSTKDTMSIALFSSGASNHGELDDEIENTVSWINSLDELVLQYAAARMTGKKDPFEIIGSIPQKIFKDQEKPEGLIPVSVD